ncbi:MAG: hypothetical protein HN929_09620 [Chloroflexi bacterium]|mgnify:CR=1 FL=1|jgi:hypothetical protein|nr:hypothetical protein [Chloroflexota bacterium]MBT7081707.1 hypothetical protein [Chloroflexota bacterium]MBT7289150.1 hypothetical protein [Chloroflexota bacterium]
MKQNFWDFKQCGRQSGGSNVAEMGICPAATDAASNGYNKGRNGGRICWAVTGTFCGASVQGSFAQKKQSCMTCDFYGKVKAEEKESGNRFSLLMPGQQYAKRA